MKHDGGQAFPKTGSQFGATNGMTLRDWFAGQAIAEAFRVSLEVPDREENPSLLAAGIAYALADAMLAVRDKS